MKAFNKTQIFILIGILFIYQIGFSQSAFENTQTIVEHLDKQKINMVVNNENLYWPDAENEGVYRSKLQNFARFLNDPFSQDLSPIDIAEILEILQSAQILSPEENVYGEKSGVDYDSFGVMGILDQLKKVSVDSKTSPISSGVSMSTRIIDGASKFLVNRTKRELSLTFYEHFYNKMNSPLYYKMNQDSIEVYLKDAIPNTFMLFDSKQIFETPSFGQTWSTAFQRDLANLPFSLLGIFERNDLFRNDDLGRFSLILMEGLKKIENGNHPIEIIESVSADYSQFNTHKVDAHLGLLNLLSQNCTKVDESTREWINLMDFNKLNKEEKKYFTGLIYQEGIQKGLIQTPRQGGKSSLKMAINDENYGIFFQGIKDVQQELINISNLLETAKSSEEKQAQSNFNNYSELFVNAINTTYETVLKINNENYYDSSFYKNYLPVSKDILSFYDGVNNNNYGSCLLSTINFLNHLSRQGEKNKSFVQDITFYGNFLVDIVFASSHEGVYIENIIDKYSLPVSSYRMKRLYHNTIDINAYPGLYSGYEFSNSDSPNFGITAPIGFSFSWRKKDDGGEKFKHSNSIFISAIDIGAPFSYRFANDNAGGLPENIKWEQIFSPGIFYVYGFKNSPMVLAAGAQFTPLLRKIETENILDDENVLRLSISLNVDIPMVNLYKSRK